MGIVEFNWYRFIQIALLLLVGQFSIKFFLKLLEKFSLKPFAIYRVILGAVVLLVLR